MADTTTASIDDIKTSGSGFTFTGKLAELAGNGDWIDGYLAVSDGSAKRNDYSTMWEMLSAGTEDGGNRLYREIRSYIDKIGNVDTCGLKALKNLADTLGFSNDLVDAGLEFPTEVNGLVEIFSVNTAYLLNKADELDTLVLANSILDEETASKFGDAIRDRDSYKAFVSSVIYNTIYKFLTLKVGKFDDGKVADYGKEIWRSNISRFTTELWSDDVTPDETVYALKSSLGVGKSFTEKIHADKVISGESKLSDFSYEEQKVIEAEIESRKTRYSDAGQMRYYFMRLYKVLEYFRFVSLTYRKIYELGEYDINANKFVVTDVSKDFSLVKNNYSDYEIDTNVVHRVSDWIADFCLNISNARTRMKRQSQVNMMKGTKRLIVDSVKEFVLSQIDSDTWKNFNDSILFDSGLNKGFDVSVVEYTDSAEYFNIENETDVVDPQANGLNPRFWEKYDDSNRAFSKDEVLAFYNRVFDDKRKFRENGEYEGGDTASNLYEFLKLLYESGATSALNSDYFTVSRTLTASEGTETSVAASGGVSERTAEVFEKFSGDKDISTSFYHNIKNSFHPSYQIHPFVQGFEEYNAAYTSVMNLVNSFSDTLETSIARLADRIDRTGCTINFWYNWNEDFTGYSTSFEKGGSDSDSKLFQDSPFNFDALKEFLTFPDEYVLNILQGINPYYKSDLTGKPLFTDAEVSLEISRLQKYRQEIMDVSGKAVYKYAKDFYGNIYILYKDEADRNNRNALGNVWVRLKNHPIAFPLFDVNESNTPFSEVSCISDSDNERLVRLLQTVVRRFNREYGVGGGFVDTGNLTLSFETKTTSALIVADDSGLPVKGEDFVVESDIGRVNLQCVEIDNGYLMEAVDDVGVKHLGSLASELSSTDYYVDSVDGTPVNAAFAVSALVGGVLSKVSNTYGQICHQPTSAFLKATYEDGVFSISRSAGDSAMSKTYSFVTFADYDDKAVPEEDVSYSYTNEYGITHPCGKRRITIRSVYNIPSDPNGESLFRGTVDSDGNVDFGVWSETGNSETASTTAKATVDGTDIYENFDNYTYSYGSGETYRYHPEKGAHDIVMVGGSNPYYVKRTVNEDSTTKIELVRANRTVDAEPDTYVFKNKAWHNIIGTVEMTSFPLSDCQIRRNERYENTLDTIHQFQLKSNQYVNYYPYTTLSGDPVDDIRLITSAAPSGCVTFYDGENDTVGHKFYYNILTQDHNHVPHALSAKIVRYETSSVTTTSKNVRLGGSISLHTNDSSKYPVTLTFNSDTDSNIGTFSTYYGSNEYQKFFDMGFSYDQKMMYLAYRDSDDEYENGGVLIGSVKERENSDNTVELTYYRDSANNVEGVEPGNIKYYHQMSERFEYFRQDHLSGDPYNVLATQIPYVKGSAMTFQSLDDLLKGGESWQSVFMGTSSTDIKTLASLAETDTRMAYSTLTSITGLVTSSIDYRTYVDNIKTVHLGDTVSKNGIYSAFGSFNERDVVLNMTVYLFMTGKTIASNFAIPLRFEPLEFDGDPLGRLSTKLSCTDKRLYLSFASQPPKAGDVLLNGINGDVNGDSGGTTYEAVSGNYGDSTVTVLSFNIEDRDTVEFEDEETRYLFKGTELGYFPQYGGLKGKNLVFRNASLSGKTEFPFEACFSPIVSGDNTSMTRTVAISGGTTAARLEISKFVNLDDEFSYSSDSRSRGLLISKDGSRTFYVPFDASVFSKSSPMFQFSNIQGRKVYDASRPHVNQNTGLMDQTVFLADGEDGNRFVGAIMEFQSNGAPTVLNMPIVYGGEYDFRTDFKKIEDHDGRVFALHSDGKTVSELEVGYWGSGFNLPSEGVVSHTLSSSRIVTKDDIDHCGTTGNYIEPQGYEGFSNDTQAKYATAKVEGMFGYSLALAFNHDDTGRILQAKVNAATADFSPFFVGASAFVTAWAGTSATATATSGIYKIYSMRDGEEFNLEKPYSETEIILEPAVQRITEFEDTRAHVGNDPSNPVMRKVFATNTQRVYRLDLYTTGDKPTVDVHEIDTFDKVVDAGILSSDTEEQNGVDVHIGHSVNHILFSYYSKEQDAHGMVYSRKITPDSVGEFCKFVDEDGNTARVNHITKILSMGTLVIAQDDEEDSTTILVSTDDGVTFVRRKELVGCNIRLIGCGLYKFFARSESGRLIHSTDGVRWVVDGTVPMSSWTSVSVNGEQYLLCVNRETLTPLYLKDRYLEVLQQATVDSDRTFGDIAIDNGVLVATSCDDPSLPIAVARADADSLSGISVTEFPFAKGSSFLDSCAFGTDLFLSPDSAERVARVVGAFDLSKTMECVFIDTSGVASSDSGTYGGFIVVNDKLLMWPETADDILVYNESGGRFFEFYPVANSDGFADCDAVLVESDGDDEVVLTPSVAESDGSVKLTVTNFSDRNNYGVVEIDEGFPIMVEYSTSTIDGGNEVTQFRFTMMSDTNGRTVTITTVPDVKDEKQKSAYERKSKATASYTVGNKTVIYTFATVGNAMRYVIGKTVGEVDEGSAGGKCLSIKYSLDGFNRTSKDDMCVKVYGGSQRHYYIHGRLIIPSSGKICVYGNFEEPYVQDFVTDEWNRVEGFEKFVFTDTVYLSGLFNNPAISLKERVADSNLSFDDGTNTNGNLSGFFDGCVNAEMTEGFVAGSNAANSPVNIVIANNMFRDCRNARLPNVQIGDSKIEVSISMFENCVNAELGNVDIPKNSEAYQKMFKNCKTATLDTITLLPEIASKYSVPIGRDTYSGDGSYDSVFYGCENGTFKNASFFTIENFSNDSPAVKGYEMPYMFYMCRNMDAQKLAFERVSPYVRVADRMFYGAGREGSVTFNDKVIVFARMNSAEEMFKGSNFEFDNTYLQFHGAFGTLREGDATTFSIPNNMTLDGIESYFEGASHAKSAPTIVLASTDVTLSDADERLDGALSGHYSKDIDGRTKGLLNFKSLYRDSSIETLDLRGVANNSDMDYDFNSNDDCVGRQFFTSMCEGCSNLAEVEGYVPPYGIDYSSMFRNCSSLELDLSKMFMRHGKDSDGNWAVEKAYSGGTMKTYAMSSMAHMFEGCANMYSSDGSFDLAMLVENCAHTLTLLGKEPAECPESFANAFGSTVPVVFREGIPELGSLVFDPEAAASGRNAIKYAASEYLDERFGFGTEYTRLLFPNGFLRYCGTLRTDPTRFVAVLYYPERDLQGNTMSLSPKTIGRSVGLSPEGFSDEYNVIQSHDNSTWYGYDYGTLYAAAVFDTATSKFLKYAYVGEYDLVRHDYMVSDGRSVRADTVSRVGATVFVGLEDTIKPLG